MSIKSINEPLGPGRTTMLTPQSINEPRDIEMPDPPIITALVPNSCGIGDPEFTLDVEGSGFYPASVIYFAGLDMPTTYNDGTLSTSITPPQQPAEGTAQVVVPCQVANGPVMSDTVQFAFLDPVEIERGGEGEGADPDDLEEEIEQAGEEGDFKPLHRGRPSKTLPKHRKK